MTLSFSGVCGPLQRELLDAGSAFSIPDKCQVPAEGRSLAGVPNPTGLRVTEKEKRMASEGSHAFGFVLFEWHQHQFTTTLLPGDSRCGSQA
ncbi:MAG: hypothetical protein ACK50J_14610 [Planctomyces sp.]